MECQSEPQLATASSVVNVGESTDSSDDGTRQAGEAAASNLGNGTSVSLSANTKSEHDIQTTEDTPTTSTSGGKGKDPLTGAVHERGTQLKLSSTKCVNCDRSFTSRVGKITEIQVGYCFENEAEDKLTDCSNVFLMEALHSVFSSGSERETTESAELRGAGFCLKCAKVASELYGHFNTLLQFSTPTAPITQSIQQFRNWHLKHPGAGTENIANGTEKETVVNMDEAATAASNTNGDLEQIEERADVSCDPITHANEPVLKMESCHADPKKDESCPIQDENAVVLNEEPAAQGEAETSVPTDIESSPNQNVAEPSVFAESSPNQDGAEQSVPVNVEPFLNQDAAELSIPAESSPIGEETEALVSDEVKSSTDKIEASASLDKEDSDSKASVPVRKSTRERKKNQRFDRDSPEPATNAISSVVSTRSKDRGNAKRPKVDSKQVQETSTPERARRSSTLKTLTPVPPKRSAPARKDSPYPNTPNKRVR